MKPFCSKVSVFAIEKGAELTDEEQVTVITECERIQSSRPLAYITGDPEDLEPLTSVHFLKKQVYQASSRGWHRLQSHVLEEKMVILSERFKSNVKCGRKSISQSCSKNLNGMTKGETSKKLTLC